MSPRLDNDFQARHRPMPGDERQFNTWTRTRLRVAATEPPRDWSQAIAMLVIAGTIAAAVVVNLMLKGVLP